MNYRNRRNYDNLNKMIFSGIGKYGVSEIQPTQYDGCKFIGFNYAASSNERVNKGIHFFLDDYQFNRVWTDPERYLKLLSQFKYVMSPDFSTYTDFPLAVQIYNHYRKHWLGAYWQKHDIKVIPTISWGTEETYKWCFDGEPMNSAVAVSSVGTQHSKHTKELFINGYNEMVNRLNPDTIIFYGNVPEGCFGNILRVKSFQSKFQEAVCNGW